MSAGRSEPASAGPGGSSRSAARRASRASSPTSGTGYLDTWHGAATLLLLPVFVAGLALTWRDTRPSRRQPVLEILASPGSLLVVAASGGMILAGLVILAIGATTVFVPEDLAYIGTDVPALCAIHPGLVPLIAHDRAGFGGGLVAAGIAALGVAVRAQPTTGRWAVLAAAGGMGFGAAIGIHAVVGYMDPVHLGPAIAGAGVLATGLALGAPQRRSGRTTSVRMAASSTRSGLST